MRRFPHRPKAAEATGFPGLPKPAAPTLSANAIEAIDATEAVENLAQRRRLFGLITLLAMFVMGLGLLLGASLYHGLLNHGDDAAILELVKQVPLVCLPPILLALIGASMLLTLLHYVHRGKGKKGVDDERRFVLPLPVEVVRGLGKAYGND